MSDFFEKFKKYRESAESYTEVSISNMQNRISDLLKTYKMTKTDLANKMGISKQNLNDFFNKGHNATFKTVGKVAHALNKKIVISFVEKDVDNKKFYNYVKNYEDFNNISSELLMVLKSSTQSFKKSTFDYDFFENKVSQSVYKNINRKNQNSYTSIKENFEVAS